MNQHDIKSFLEHLSQSSASGPLPVPDSDRFRKWQSLAEGMIGLGGLTRSGPVRPQRAYKNNQIKLSIPKKRRNVTRGTVKEYFANEFPQICHHLNPTLRKIDLEPTFVKPLSGKNKFLVRFQDDTIVDEICRVYSDQKYIYSKDLGNTTIERCVDRRWKGECTMDVLSVEVGDWRENKFHSRSPLSLVEVWNNIYNEAPGTKLTLNQNRMLLQWKPDQDTSSDGANHDVTEEPPFKILFYADNIEAVSFQNGRLFLQCVNPPPLYEEGNRETSHKYNFHHTAFCFKLGPKEQWMNAWIRLNLQFAQKNCPQFISYKEEPIFEHFADYSQLHFDTKYLVKSCIHNGVLTRSQVSKPFLLLLQQLGPQDQLLFLANLFPKDFSDPVYELQSWIEELKGKEDKLQLEYDRDRLILLKHIHVTPSRLIFSLPIFESSSRFTREFKDYHNQFARVHFVDDDLENTAGFDSFVDHCRKVMERGIPLDEPFHTFIRDDSGESKCSFQFLAFGASQLKEQTSFFLLKDNTQESSHHNSEFEIPPPLTAESVRKQLGHFDELKSVASYVARIGQCFSDTRSSVVPVHPHEVGEIPDITSGPYTFTDGVGRVSKSHAKEIAESVFHMQEVPSAIQMRFSGYKGVLFVAPDDLMQGKKILCRDSQRKFKTPHFELEICEWSHFKEAFLNRQFIALFSHRKIADEVFQSFLDSHLKDLDEMFSDKEKALHVVLHAAVESSTSEANIPLSRMICEYSLRDKCVQTLLTACKKRQVADLEQRARIPVPYTKDGKPGSALLMGVIDEFDILEEGQIFVHCQDKNSGNAPFVVSGPITVGKNPAVHPGDLRLFQGVHSDILKEHYKDVVVFSAKGDRPAADQMSGSDLDGDLFGCFWHPDLIPTTPDCDPYHYASPGKLVREDSIQSEDLIQFFCDSVKSNKLGILCNLHLARSEKNGLDSPECLALVERIQRALDYGKTGIAPDSWEEYTLHPEDYPIFLKRRGGTDYGTILCKLYLKAHRVRSSFDKKSGISSDTTEEDISWYTRHFAWEGYEQYIEAAGDLMAEYVVWCDTMIQIYQSHADDETDIILSKLSKLPKKMRKHIPHSVRQMQTEICAKAKEMYGEEKKAFMSALLLTCYDEKLNPKTPSRRMLRSRHRKKKDNDDEGNDGVQRGLLLPWLIDGDCLLEIFHHNKKKMEE